MENVEEISRLKMIEIICDSLDNHIIIWKFIFSPFFHCQAPAAFTLHLVMLSYLPCAGRAKLHLKPMPLVVPH